MSISLSCSSLNLTNIVELYCIAFNNKVEKKTTKNTARRPILKSLCFFIKSDLR